MTPNIEVLAINEPRSWITGNYQRTAKVRRNRRPQLRQLEAGRVTARDRRWPRSGAAKWKAQHDRPAAA